ncbi:MAG: hypothetical protein AAF525_05240 [Pseudomonadota bacterium]
MKPYGSGDRTSGVIAFDYGADYICLRFSEGYDYTYTWDSCSRVHVQNMKALANQGKGLMAYLNRHVSDQFVSRLPSPDPASVMLLNEAIFEDFAFPLYTQIRHDREVLLSRHADREIDIGDLPGDLLTVVTANELCRYCETVGTRIRAKERNDGDWLEVDSELTWPEGIVCVSKAIGVHDLFRLSSGVAGAVVTPKQVIAFVLFSELPDRGDEGEFKRSLGALTSQLMFAFAAQLAQDVD